MFKKLLILIITLIISATFSFAEYNVNLKNISMKDFVKFVSEFTDTNFVFDEKDLVGQVTIDSRLEMRTNDILEIFYTTLEMNNLQAIDEGKYIQIIKSSRIKDYEDDYEEKVNLNSKHSSFLTTIFHVEGLDAKVVAASFNKLKSRGGFVQSLKGINAIIIRDSRSRIKKMIEITENLEAHANLYQLKALKINNTTATNVEKGLKKFFSELKKHSLLGSDPVIIADDFSNILLIASTEKDFNKILYMVAQIDVPGVSSTNSPKVFYLKNSSAEDVEKVLNKLLSKMDTKQKIIKFNVASDKSTNSIIVVGDKMLYKSVESLIAKLDIPRKQVYVETLIIETTLEKGSEFGVEWIGGGGSSDSYGVVGNLDKDSSGSSSLIALGTSGPTALPGGFSLGVIGNSITFNGITFPTLGVLMHAVNNLSGINILSNPQLLTLDNEDAEIFVGENRPFLTSEKYDSNDNLIQTFDYRDVGISLKITPHISNDDMVTLNIEQEIKKVTSSTSSSTMPITLTRKTTTKVKLKNGSTMVISGLIKDDSSTTNQSVPWLSKIPFLGWLFKSESKGFEKTNMMVFISAYIIDSQYDAETLTGEKMIKASKFKEDIRKRINSEFYNKSEDNTSSIIK